MQYYQCLNLVLVIGCTILEDASGIAKVRRSADENLRDPGTYIIQLEDSATDAQLQHFTKQLNERSNRRAKFEGNIIAEFPNINCLIAKLSERALKWVRMISSNILQCLQNTQLHLRDQPLFSRDLLRVGIN